MMIEIKDLLPRNPKKAFRLLKENRKDYLTKTILEMEKLWRKLNE